MMNDDDVLCAVRDRLHEVRESLGDVRMARPASSILDRARHRRLRRGLAGAGAGTAALGAAVALVLGQPAARPVHVNLDAWSVNSHPGGVVTVTLRELRDPAGLRRALAEAGVPAVVTFGKYCVPVTQGAAGAVDLPSFHARLPLVIVDPVIAGPSKMAYGLLMLNPATLRKGTELDLGVEAPAPGRGPGSFEVMTDITRPGVPLVCHT